VRIWTIGHSTRGLDEFFALLAPYGIEAVADVRRYPGSRRLPHFSQDALSASLAETRIAYAHFPELGGRRRPRPDSPNTTWRDEAFRGYADYMSTDEFRAGIARLLDTAHGARTAYLCAEALWWRCHRRLISDHLKAAGHEVIHILGPDKTEIHPFTPPARIVDGRLSYLPPQTDLFDS
jgi:uncharacterized protein (DUF488 family)